ncbi:type I polyketide synthase [Nocardiopsis sp. CC223A]|uniref:type I polyketide synthase n=1 Tax=Nocardiopsis sp. CC223A TaxID=3044051 RepID=UPI00278BE9B8|nr:type I polyketide synthase [Nocardiopsis sp. CC223A]
MTAPTASPSREPVAIIGMGCRLPGNIDTPGLLWKALLGGRDRITRIPQERWETMVAHLHPDQVPAAPYPAGVVDHRFDHDFFGISADEAAEMDPQQGWLLEVVHEALADAGITPASLAGSATGVYVGAASIDQTAVNFGNGRRAGVFTGSGAGMAILANRLSHHLDLAGPSLTLDTACSSSLTALHYAACDLRSSEIDLALVAGTNILTAPTITASFVETGVLSPEGRCRPFDRAADGYVRSEGAVVLVLARAGVAAERGHRVWAHVAGTGLGHGGHTPHLLAPRASRQATAITRALADAGIGAGRVGWVQAHGTGTKAGDRIEADGIARALGQDEPVPVGSVKSTLGHLEGAAGALGVMVAALAVHHGQLPPTAHHTRLRSGLENKVRVPVQVEPWPTASAEEGKGQRVAGVSSFGFGGANAHAIITQAQATEPPAAEDPMPLPETVMVSAHSAAALAHAAERLAEQVPGAGSVGIVADTALARGLHLRCRAAVVARDLGGLVQGLRALQDGTPSPDVTGPGQAPTPRPRVVFVYTGHGGHHPDAGVQFMQVPVFAAAVAEARTALSRRTGYDVWAPGDPITGFVDAQHSTFLVQAGLTALLAERGIHPDLVLGHSVGEIAAAHTAAVLPLDTAARVLAERSRLLGGLTGTGGLLAVRATVDRVEEHTAPCADRVTIASYSAPGVQVVAGPVLDLDHLQADLTGSGVWCKRVPDAIPAHSPAVDPVVPELRRVLAGLVPHPAQVPIISTTDPTDPTDPAGLWSPAYWADQVRSPVQFTDALHTAAAVLGEESVVFVEIGPKALLVEHIAHTLPDHATVAITAHPDGLAHGIGALYTHGVTPTGPAHCARPHLVIPPGWDHTGRPAPAHRDGPVPLPEPGQVPDYLAAEVARLVHLPDGLDSGSTWAETGLTSHSLLQLTTRLRRVPAWAGIDVQLFLPSRTWAQVAADLADLLPASGTAPPPIPATRS